VRFVPDRWPHIAASRPASVTARIGEGRDDAVVVAPDGRIDGRLFKPRSAQAAHRRSGSRAMQFSFATTASILEAP
jgi:hypothetical protein